MLRDRCWLLFAFEMESCKPYKLWGLKSLLNICEKIKSMSSLKIKGEVQGEEVLPQEWERVSSGTHCWLQRHFKPYSNVLFRSNLRGHESLRSQVLSRWKYGYKIHLVQGRHRRQALRDQKTYRAMVCRRRSASLQRHRVSNHNGFLKLMGSCLEFPFPVLVFEDLDYRVLNVGGSLGCEDAPLLLPWNARLKIAKEVATAITYLHTAFPRIIIHREINPTNVFLDKNGMAKLTWFKKRL